MTLGLCDAEHKRLINDAVYFLSRTSKLYGSVDLGEKILDFVKDNAVESNPETIGDKSTGETAGEAERKPTAGGEKKNSILPVVMVERRKLVELFDAAMSFR